jgi:hypothetical protein
MNDTALVLIACAAVLLAIALPGIIRDVRDAKQARRAEPTPPAPIYPTCARKGCVRSHGDVCAVCGRPMAIGEAS